MTIYLDCNATAPMVPEVIEIVRYYMEVEFANSGSRTHAFGSNTNKAVELARKQLADVVAAKKDEIIFTSGATESNNLVILGLEEHLKRSNKCHVITSAIEHKSVLEPCKVLESRGIKVTYVKPREDGVIDVDALISEITEDTGLISVMHVNNETGTIQPVDKIATLIKDDVLLHTDAAQGFAKDLDSLRNTRIDLISISGHKIHGPKGIGALVRRRRSYKKPPIAPLLYGGGQEKGLRPGTLPVALIAGLGVAATELEKNNSLWWEICKNNKKGFLTAFSNLSPIIHGQNTLPNIVNFSIPGINSEAAIIALKDIAAFSNGSACTSTSYELSHVLAAMSVSDEVANSSIRMSWCHITGDIPWNKMAVKLSKLLN